MAVIEWQTKDAADTRPYGVNWAPMLVGGDTLVSASIVLVSGAIINSQSNGAQTTVAIISGGTNGVPARFTATMTTSSGKIFKENIELPICSSACDAYEPQTATKRTIVQMAFEGCGLPGYSFTASADEISSAVRRLDAMMRMYSTSYDFGYNFPSVLGQSDPDDASGLTDNCVIGVAGKLARQFAPSLGKSLSPDFQRDTAEAWNMAVASVVRVPRAILPRTTPRGSGNRFMWQPFIVEATCC
jgi:subtilisin family serine protease